MAGLAGTRATKKNVETIFSPEPIGSLGIRIRRYQLAHSVTLSTQLNRGATEMSSPKKLPVNNPRANAAVRRALQSANG
jgi:hypothetical protein